MRGFSGFPTKGRMTRIPAVFFSELLPQIDHLGEMKVTLYCFWRLGRQDNRHYLWERELYADDLFLSGLGARQEERRAALADGLERAVARGTLLMVTLEKRGRKEKLYFFNSERGRQAFKEIEAGRWEPEDDRLASFDLSIERPNIFTLYEQNIGPLTPMIGEDLRDLEETYGEDAIAEAIQIAVERNVLHLRYIIAILKKNQAGADQSTPLDEDYGDRYVSGKYSDEVEG